MSRRTARRPFAARPVDAETWVRTREALSSRNSEARLFIARLTIDVTPEQRARIKVTAFRRGQTVADMLRELLAREFPDKDGDPQ
jgi:Ni/Co efflux regulator RcnB